MTSQPWLAPDRPEVQAERRAAMAKCITEGHLVPKHASGGYICVRCWFRMEVD